MTVACQPLPRALAEDLLQFASRAICERPGETNAQRDSRTRQLVYAVIGFEPRDGLEFMLATMTVGHFNLIIDAMHDVFQGPAEAVKAKTRASIVALDRVTFSMIKELAGVRQRPLAVPAQDSQPRTAETPAGAPEPRPEPVPAQSQAGQGQAGQAPAAQKQAGHGQAGHGQAAQGQAGQGQAGQGQAGQGQVARPAATAGMAGVPAGGAAREADVRPARAEMRSAPGPAPTMPGSGLASSGAQGFGLSEGLAAADQGGGIPLADKIAALKAAAAAVNDRLAEAWAIDEAKANEAGGD